MVSRKQSRKVIKKLCAHKILYRCNCGAVIAPTDNVIHRGLRDTAQKAQLIDR